MKFAVIDGTSVTSMEDIHAALAQQLAFPEWYGGNLDALHDCLTDLHEETHVSVAHPEALLETLGPAYGRLCRVLSNAAEENPYLKIQL